MTWGLVQASEIRCHVPSYGTEIEVPAVIELLDLVVAGDISAEEARACLNRTAVSINEEMHREYSRRLSFDEDVPTPPKQPVAPEAPVLDSRWVYAVSSESDPKAIKIGVAGDISKRLRALQIGSASPIALRWSTPGGYPLERHLHETFDKRRISGEWFDFRRVADPVKKIAEAANIFLKQFDSDQPDAA
jgi:hypothetical protein